MKFKVMVDGNEVGQFEEQAEALVAFEGAAGEGTFTSSVELLKVMAVATHGVQVMKLARQRNAAVKKQRKAKKVKADEGNQ